jgi:cytoskeletal protein RodZ
MEAEALNFDLRRLAETTAEMQAPPRVEAALLQEFRRTTSVDRRRKFQRDLAALAIAALILLALGIGFYRHQVKLNGSGAAQTTAQNSTQPAPPSSTTPATGENSNVNSAQPSAQPSSTDSDESEYATSFVPLPYADDPSETQGGAVVRVDLPRASLVSMGIPVAGLNAGGHVVADLMLSEDGTPQAIRLISESNSTQEF